MPLEEQEVLPTPHAQQDATNDGEVVRMFRVDSDLGRRAAGNVVGRRILVDVDQRDGSATRWALSHVLEGPGGLKLPARDRVEHTTHLTLEYPAGDGVESNFGLVTRSNPLQGVLLEPGRQHPIVLMHEDHDRPKGCRHDKHAGS